MTTEKEKDDLTASRDAANIKLAIILGLLAFGVYAVFLWFNLR